jgi:hypothetical protein
VVEHEDDGAGESRVGEARHRHEQGAGRTSSRPAGRERGDRVRDGVGQSRAGPAAPDSGSGEDGRVIALSVPHLQAARRCRWRAHGGLCGPSSTLCRGEATVG